MEPTETFELPPRERVLAYSWGGHSVRDDTTRTCVMHTVQDVLCFVHYKVLDLSTSDFFMFVPSRKCHRATGLSQTKTARLDSAVVSAAQGFLFGWDTSAGASSWCVSICPLGLLSTASAPLPGTVPEWVTYEQASYVWISYETRMKHYLHHSSWDVTHCWLSIFDSIFQGYPYVSFLYYNENLNLFLSSGWEPIEALMLFYAALQLQKNMLPCHKLVAL